MTPEALALSTILETNQVNPDQLQNLESSNRIEMTTQNALEDLRSPMLMAYRGELEAIDRMGGSEALIFCENTHGEDSELISFNDSQRKITCTGKPIGWNFGAGGGSIGGSSHSENHTYSLDNVCRYFNNTKLNGRARLYQKVFGEFVNPDYSRVFYRDGECIGVKKY